MIGSWARRVFAIDLRALALLRMLSAMLVLASLFDRARYFFAFYTDAGVLTAAAARGGARFPPWDGTSWIQPFAWAPDPWGSVGLFLTAAVAAVFLLFGRSTKIAGLLAWLMLTGIDNRNPLVIDAGDDLLRLLLFWELFLPVSARWSADARALPPPGSKRVLSAGTVALIVQLAMIYPVSTAFKSHRAWVTEPVALHYALHLEQFVTPLGIAIRDHLPTATLSAATWWLELAGPLLLFSPFATEPLRYLLFFSFGAMHAGIALTMGLWLFSVVCIVAWLVTLPSSFWDRIDPAPSARPSREAVPQPTNRSLLDWAAGIFLAYVMLWNIWTMTDGVWFPTRVRAVGYRLRLAQLWGMFSPAPANHSTWLELSATTPDGAVFRLRPDGRPCDCLHLTPERLLSERWRKFHERVVQTPGDLAVRYANFLSKRFEAAHGTPGKVTVVWMRRASPPPDGSKEIPRLEDARLLATAVIE